MNKWEELEDRIEKVLFGLQVSLDSMKSFPEIRKYVEEEIQKLHKPRYSASGLDRLKLSKKIIEYRDIYANYLIKGKHLADPREEKRYREYQSEINQLFHDVKMELTLLKSDFEEAKGEEKISLGDCLIDASLIYQKLAKELYQKPSPDYHSIFREIVNSINEVKSDSHILLNNLYDSTGGDPNVEKNIKAIRTGEIKEDSLTNAIDYLLEKGLIKFDPDREMIKLTTESVKAKNNPNIYFGPVIQLGDLTDSSIQIQQDSPGAAQELSINTDKKDELLKEINELKETINICTMNNNYKKEIMEAIKTLEVNLKLEIPKRSIINKCGEFLMNAMITTLGSTATREILSKLPALKELIGGLFKG